MSSMNEEKIEFKIENGNDEKGTTHTFHFGSLEEFKALDDGTIMRSIRETVKQFEKYNHE